MCRILFITLAFFCSSTIALADSIKDLFSSDPEQVVNLASDNDFLIGKVINPLSGQPCIRHVDLVAKGAQSIALERTFIPNHTPIKRGDKVRFSDQSYAGWVHFPHVRLSLCTSGKKKKIEDLYVCVVDTNGVTLVYSLMDGKCELESDPWGICNGIGDCPSGCHDPRNTVIKVEGNHVVVRPSGGGIRYYRLVDREDLYLNKDFYISTFFLLEKEVLPNGKILRYGYKNKQLVSVSSWDPQEKHKYASLELHSSPFTCQAEIVSNSGTSVRYDHLTKSFYDDKETKRPISLLYPFLLSNVSTPYFKNETIEGRKAKLVCGNGKKEYTGLIKYVGETLTFHNYFREVIEKNSACQIIKNDTLKKLSSHYRTHSLLLPDSNDNFESAFSFDYEVYTAGVKAGKTTVSHWDGAKTVYHISPKMLPTSIQYYDKEGNLKKEKLFSWSQNQWLSSLEVRDGERSLSKKSFEYDQFGNPILERFEGDLRGNGEWEAYATKRAFSEDGRHLLLREECENGKRTLFNYLSNTHLLTSKIIQHKGRMLRREFREYDEAYNLIKIIQDNGDPSKRRVTNYVLRQEQPFLHMPEVVIEGYEENSVYHQLTRTCLHYDKYGNVVQEDVHDAEDQYRYSIYKEYNERGDVLSETDALGFKTIYEYDAHGRITKELNASQTQEKTFTYDAKGRQKSTQEQGLKDEVLHQTFAAYNHNDLPIKKIDTYGNEIRYAYDVFSGEPNEIIYPFLFTCEGVNLVAERFTYDALDRQLKYVDANNNTTEYTYNAYGSPVATIYADGSSEYFSYTKAGTLESHIAQDGVKIVYEHDVCGRVLKKSYSHKDQYWGKETFDYEGDHLIQSTDLANHVTNYSYDGAGRKIRKEIHGRVTIYSYDTLGFLKTVCEDNADEPLYTHYTRDLLGQILEKTCQDKNNHILSSISYTYDAEGNTTSIQTANSSKEVFEYDSQQRVISHIDSLGNETKTFYNEHVEDLASGRVLQKRTVFPNHVSLLETYDSFDRIAKTEKRNPQDEVISSSKNGYDPCGNLSFQKLTVYEGANKKEAQRVEYEYDSLHRLKSFTRGDHSDSRTTQFSYTQEGKIASKTLPSGIVLSYTYHPLGYLSGLTSSNGEIQHVFEYDRLGNLLKAVDAFKSVWVERQIDAFGNVLSETFSNGLNLRKSYDRFDRPLKVILPDQSVIQYTYDALYLKSVERFSATGKLLYTHTYDQYDLSGNLEQETLIKNSGSVAYRYDEKHRIARIESPYFTQNGEYDETGNLLKIVSNDQETQFTYDLLDQLTSESCGGEKEHYTYDSAFKRIKKDGDTWRYNALDELLSTEDERYTYDANGNLSTKTTPEGVFKYYYDPLNQLVEVVKPDSKIQLTYDPLGRRIGKVVYSPSKIEKERYLYDGNCDIATCNEGHELQELQVLGYNDQGTRRAVAVELAGKAYAVLYDCQRNIKALVDPTHLKVSTNYAFTAFGERKDQNDEQLFNPWQYASKRFDPDLNLIDFGKRYYDPALGRWLTTDPEGFVNSLNLYQYNFNNPLRYTDPDGRFVFVIPLLFGTFGAGAAAATAVAIEITATELLIGSVLTGATLWGAHEALTFLDRKINTIRYSNAIYNETSSELETKGKKKRAPVRTNPIDLEEKLTLDEAIGSKGDEILKDKLKDRRYPSSEWQKMKHHRKHPDGTVTEVHWWQNTITGAREGYKFKDKPDNFKSRIYKPETLL